VLFRSQVPVCRQVVGKACAPKQVHAGLIAKIPRAKIERPGVGLRERGLARYCNDRGQEARVMNAGAPKRRRHIVVAANFARYFAQIGHRDTQAMVSIDAKVRHAGEGIRAGKIFQALDDRIDGHDGP